MLSEMLVQPNPGVVISDANEDTLPLEYFHLVVIVEPDPETYIPLPDDLPKLDFVIERMSEAISDENDPDEIRTYKIKIPEDMPETSYLWVGYDGINLFGPVTEKIPLNVAFYLAAYDDLDHFAFYLKGISSGFKGWRVAVIGAMFEDDIIRVANFIEAIGFSVTILQRYCLSNSTFVNLDNLFEYSQWLRSYQSPEERKFLLDELDEDDELGDDNDGI